MEQRTRSSKKPLWLLACILLALQAPAEANYRVQVQIGETSVESSQRTVEGLMYLADALSAEVLFASIKSGVAVLSVPERWYPLLKANYPHYRDCVDAPSHCGPARVRVGAHISEEASLRLLLENAGFSLSPSELRPDIDTVIVTILADIESLKSIAEDPVVQWLELGTDAPQTPGPPFCCEADYIAYLGVSRRFSVKAAYSSDSSQLRPANPVELGAESVAFFFFHPDNLELNIKVLDGCGINDHYWVFAAGLTDVETELVVEDLERGIKRTYRSALGQPFDLVRDITAFRCSE